MTQPQTSLERRCGDCQLCCTLLPVKVGAPRVGPDLEGDSEVAVLIGNVRKGLDGLRQYSIPEFNKPANTRCQHQRDGVGCAVYERRPVSCRLWSCRWLNGTDTADQLRPDRSHVVIDAMPDFVTLRNNDTGKTHYAEVVQVWIDPAYPDAHRSPALRAYLTRQAANGVMALVRNGSHDAFLLVPPSIASDGEWREVRGVMEPDHGAEERWAARLAQHKRGELS